MYRNVVNFNRAKKEESLSYYLVSVIFYQTIYDNRKYARERRVREIIAVERKNRPSLDDDKIYSHYRRTSEDNRHRRVIKGEGEAKLRLSNFAGTRKFVGSSTSEANPIEGKMCA